MIIKEVVLHEHGHDSYYDFEERLKELGLARTFPYLYHWIYTGRFNLPYSKLDRYEAAFYAIRNVLPQEVLDSYANLEPHYRGFVMTNTDAKKIDTGGLAIKSRIAAWSPFKDLAKKYATTFALETKPAGVVLKHKPQQHEVILSMNKPTREFLNISSNLVVNYNEAILSLPLLRITPQDIVGRYYYERRIRTFANLPV